MINKAEALGEQIFKEIMDMHHKTHMTLINRVVSYDFVRLFKETALDYVGNCVLLERLYPKELCSMRKREVKRLPEEGVELKNRIVTTVFEVGNNKELSDEEKITKLNEAQDLQKQLADIEYVDDEVELLTYSPFGEEDQDSYIVLDLSSEKVNKRQYQSFCHQLGYFAFSYFSTLLMIPTEGFDLEIMAIKNTSYIDIIAKVK